MPNTNFLSFQNERLAFTLDLDLKEKWEKGEKSREVSLVCKMSDLGFPG